MTGRVEGKVAFITGAARGQGRAHAIRLAQEGADIIAIDILEPVATSVGPGATAEDMVEVVAQVEALDRRIIATKVDVRDYDGLKGTLERGVAELGRLDIVVANAGMWSYDRMDTMAEDMWQEVIDINLTGAWHTAKAAIPLIREGKRGGSIVLTSSVGGLKASQNLGHYIAAKHGIVGLMRTLALELAPEFIRVNSVHPTNVNTLMIKNDETYRLFRPDLENPTFEDTMDGFRGMNAIPVPYVEPEDIANAVLFLASDEARYITGITLPVDAGIMLK